jgi:hypothetical protein
MKKFTLAICLLFASTICAHAKTPPNPADYTVTVHVTGSHFRSSYGSSLVFDCLIDGKKIELSGSPLLNPQLPAVLKPGDYRARIIQTNKYPAYLNTDHYQLLLPDNKTADFAVTGLSE